MAVKLSYLDNPRQTVQDLYNKEDVFRDGTYLPELDKSSTAYKEAQQFLSIIPSTLNKIVGVRYKGLFKTGITRNVEVTAAYQDIYNKLNESVDATGMSRDEFIASAAEYASMLDYSFVVMDNFSQEEINANKTAELKIENRIFPFFKNVSATQSNWNYYKIDNYGRITQFGYDYIVLDDDGKQITRTKVMTKEEYQIYEEGDLIETIPHTLGEIPVFVLKNNKNIKNSLLETSSPSMWNVVKVVLNTATLRAFADASELVNCVKIWAYPGTKEQMQELSKGNAPKVINNENIFIYDGEFANKPDVISPGAGNSEIILKTEQWKLESLFIDEGMNYTSGANASGKAKQIDREQINTGLGFLCNSLISLEKWMDQLFAKSMEFEIISADYVYPKQFGIDAVKEQLEELQYILDIGADRYPQLEKRILKEAYSLKFNKKEDIEELETELENGEIVLENLQTVE